MKITAKSDTNLLGLLRDYFPECSGAKVRKMIMYGCVSYRGAVVKSPEMLLKRGDWVEYTKYTGGTVVAKQKTELPVIYEDRDLIVVNKAGGIKFSSNVSYKGKTICSMTKSYLRRKYKGSQPLFPVHWVDDQEGGLCLLARTKSAAEKLEREWENVEKIYLCIVENPLEKDTLKLNNYLLSAKNDTPRPEHSTQTQSQQNNSLFGGTETKKEFSKTKSQYSDIKEDKTISLQYHLVQPIEAGKEVLNLIELRLLEGTTKDCRAYLAKSGNPVLADFVYGSRRFKDNFLKICLVGLKFKHPYSGESISLRIEAPRGFNTVNIK